MDITIFHETMYEKYAKAEERRRRWRYAVLIMFLLLVASVLVPVVYRMIW
jgi:hypothetical protein